MYIASKKSIRCKPQCKSFLCNCRALYPVSSNAVANCLALSEPFRMKIFLVVYDKKVADHHSLLAFSMLFVP